MPIASTAWRLAMRDSSMARARFSDSISCVPLERWCVETDPSVSELTARFGSCLADVALYDEAVFGMSHNEAQLCDAQQRLLEVLGSLALERKQTEALAATGLCLTFETDLPPGKLRAGHAIQPSGGEPPVRMPINSP